MVIINANHQRIVVTIATAGAVMLWDGIKGEAHFKTLVTRERGRRDERGRRCLIFRELELQEEMKMKRRRFI